MAKSVCIVQGHPHAGGKHLCHVLAEHYAAGVRTAGAGIETIDIGAIRLDVLKDPADMATAPSAEIRKAQEKVTRCNHLTVVYPLWLGAMPAIVKAFFEQLSRKEFAIAASAHGWPRKMLKGRSARVIVTMGMPAAAYRLLLGGHGVKGFESAVLGMAGFKPIKETLIGGVGALQARKAEALFARMHALGAKDAGKAPSRPVARVQ
jgi:putative NADPH-quinone reductase